jgi:DNA-binding NtrC family response regulator
LRERREDIFELAVYFLHLRAGRTGKPVTHLDPEAVEALAAYDWPGNIRELENVMERAVVLADGPAITLDDLPAELGHGGRRGLRPRLPAPPGGRARRERRTSAMAGSPPGSGPDTAPAWSTRDLSTALEENGGDEFAAYERQRLLDALGEAGGNKSVAARLLGLPRSTFFSKLKKHGIA